MARRRSFKEPEIQAFKEQGPDVQTQINAAVETALRIWANDILVDINKAYALSRNPVVNAVLERVIEMLRGF